MDYKKLISDFGIAVTAQGFNAAASTILTLVLPKLLGITDFGYWQLFIFYAGYVGFFHLGINDGVYLKKGGEDRSVIDKRDINSQFWLSTCIQVVFSALIMAIAVFGPFEESRSFVIFATGFLITINNAGLFLGYVFQAMNETRIFSVSVAVESIALLLGLIAMALAGISSFEPYVLLYCITKIIRLVYCISHSIIFFKSGLYTPTKTAIACLDSIRIGIKLMIANIAGSLILGIARFLIDMNWGVEDFSAVSFSLSITSFFMLFLSQASMVIFPSLRQSGTDSIKRFFELARNILNTVLPIVYLAYFPIVSILGLWLPDYSDSLFYFSFVFPLCVFEGKMDILCTTYLKVLRGEGQLLKINLVAVTVCFLLSVIAVYVMRSIELTLTIAVLVLGVRELYAEKLISEQLGTNIPAMSFCASLISVAFTIISLSLSPEAITAVYAILLLCYLVAFRKHIDSWARAQKK